MSAPTNATYLLSTANPTELPSSLVLTTGSSSNLALTAGVGTYTLNPTGILLSLTQLATTGIMVNNNGTILAKTIQNGSTNSINVTNGTGALGGNIRLDVIDGTTVQKVMVDEEGALKSTRSTLNFKSGAGIEITVADNNTDNRADITITAPGGAGSVTSISANSQTGVVVTLTPDDPITETGNIAINLPGSEATTAAVLEGDLLVGNDAGEYEALGIATGGEGDLLTIYNGNAAWRPFTSPDPLPGSVVQLLAGPSPQDATLAYAYYYVADPNVTATTRIAAWPQGAAVEGSGSYTNYPCNGVDVWIYPEGIPSTSTAKGFILVSTASASDTNFCAYQVLSYT